MSRIYQPPAQPFDPLYLDCLDNALMRQNLAFTTSSTTLVTVKDIPLIANLIDTDGKRINVEIEGNLSSVANDTIFLGITFDGAPLVAIQAAGIVNTASVYYIVKSFRRGANMVFQGIIIAKNSGTDDGARVCINNAVATNVNFALAHTLTITTRVQTGTSVLSLFGMSVDVL